MAIFSFSMSVISRGAGQSAFEAAAYQAREQMEDDNGLKTRDYRFRSPLSCPSFILAPPDAPAWCRNRKALWSAIEEKENRKNSQLARALILALPQELSSDQRKELLIRFAKDAFVSEGMIADVAMHQPDPKGDQRNFHAHILLTMRGVSADGFDRKKNRSWNDKEKLVFWRKCWAELGSEALLKAGFSAEAEAFGISHLTLQEQRKILLKKGDKAGADRCDRTATTHMGAAAVAVKRRGDRPRKDGRPRVRAEKIYSPETIEKIRKRTELSEKLVSLWKKTETAGQFAAGISDLGFVLARGDKKDFVVVNKFGDCYNLAKLIRDPRPDENGAMRSSNTISDIRQRLDATKETLPLASDVVNSIRRRMTKSARTTRTWGHLKSGLLGSVMRAPAGVTSGPSAVFARSSIQMLGPCSDKAVSQRTAQKQVEKPVFAMPLREVAANDQDPIFDTSLMDVTAAGRAQMAYDDVMSLLSMAIDEIVSNKFRTSYDKQQAISALRDRQRFEAKQARKRILTEERQKIQAARKASSAKVVRGGARSAEGMLYTHS